MTDTLRVLRDQERSADDTWDETLGRYTNQPDAFNSADYEEIYLGPGSLSSQGWQPEKAMVGGAEVVVSRFKASVPLDAPTVTIRDYIEIVESINEHLTGALFVVRDTLASTLAVSQELLVERRLVQVTR